MKALKSASTAAFAAAVGLVLVGGPRSVAAKTVALWPMEKLDSQSRLDLRCVIDSANDLQTPVINNSTTNLVTVASDIGWSLPPNPDSARHAWTPLNTLAFQVKKTGASNEFLYNDSVSSYLRRERTFTIEGYMKLLDIPEIGSWGLVCGGFDDAVHSQNRWTLSLRRRTEDKGACSWIFWGNGSDDHVLRLYESEAASYALTNRWMHLAFVHRPTDASHDNWKFYIDGDLIGECTKYHAALDSNGKRFSLGGRFSGANLMPAQFDYWRVSDVALEPSAFLCAGGSGTAVTNATVAYWPLGVTENGGVDGRDAVGDSPLTSGFNDMSNFRACRIGASEDCAFTGNPPNSTVTLSSGNKGCMQGSQTSGCLWQNDLGAALNLSESFTVEGWFAPRVCERSIKGAEAACYLFGTRPDYNKGWSFQYRQATRTSFKFDLYCIDQSGSVIHNNPVLSGAYDMAGWYEKWHHVALVYDKEGGAAGFGRWTLFINGAETGHADNKCAISPLTDDARPFILGGRGEVNSQSFQGKIDCVRVCQAALTPAQFLCTAEGGTAATNVLALWPLNVERGYYLDLRDHSGQNKHFAKKSDYYSSSRVTAVVDEAPVITNPDSSPTFRGDSAKVSGCALFREVGGSNQHRSYMMTGSTRVTEAIGRGRNFTFECYYRRTRDATDTQEVIVMAANDQYARTRIFRDGKGLYVWDGLHGSELKDTLIPGTADGDLKANTWYHLAIVHDVSAGKSDWRVYVDGVLKGTASSALWTGTQVPATVMIGGRWFRDNNSVNGYLSSVRLSNRVLATNEFLCAAAPEPTAVRTAGYWPIDDGTGAGLANAVDAECPFEASGEAAASSDRARSRIPNKNALAGVVTGMARANRGSYALAGGGALAAPSVGYALNLHEPFTVEGWLKWTPSSAEAEEDLVTVGDGTNEGVRLSIETAGGASHLRVWACGTWPATPFVDAAFDADLSPYAGAWTHLAVVYDPTDGAGTWALFANGEQIGEKVANFYWPTSLDYFRSGILRIGSAAHPLSGAVDMWRVTESALQPSDFLFAKPYGSFLLLR